MNGRFSAKLGASILGGFIVASTGLASFGALPGAAQGVASTMLSKVGISVAGPAFDAGGNPDVRHADRLAGTRPASTGTRISELATTTKATGVAKGALISTAASGGMSQAGSHGSAATAQAGS